MASLGAMFNLKGSASDTGGGGANSVYGSTSGSFGVSPDAHITPQLWLVLLLELVLLGVIRFTFLHHLGG